MGQRKVRLQLSHVLYISPESKLSILLLYTCVGREEKGEKGEQSKPAVEFFIGAVTEIYEFWQETSVCKIPEITCKLG